MTPTDESRGRRRGPQIGSQGLGAGRTVARSPQIGSNGADRPRARGRAGGLRRPQDRLYGRRRTSETDIIRWSRTVIFRWRLTATSSLSYPTGFGPPT